ncbi:DUF2283 domain-containing protein [Candidatus Micrarchaeota archaeon]|nr:DUF2283 domain-containing protein [Candidatus Micrarchaeota archaeon]
MQVSTRVLQSDYDSQTDTLYLYSTKEKTSTSVSLGDLIIDYAPSGEVIGIEFLNATKTLPPLLLTSPKTLFKDEHALNPGVLQKIAKSRVHLDTVSSFIVITFTLEIDKKEIQAKLSLPTPTTSKQVMDILSTA